MMKMQILEHSPTLNTVLMVEDVLKNVNESVITIAELKRKLPKQVNHNTLMIILDYLEKSNKILVSLRGITWIYNTNENMKKAITSILHLKGSSEKKTSEKSYEEIRKKAFEEIDKKV